MTAHTSHIEEVRAVRSTRERVARLLRKYPHVSDGDREEILRFMKEARHLDIGLLTANDNLRPQLDAFMEDHKRQFRITVAEAPAAIGSIALLLVALSLIWKWLS